MGKRGLQAALRLLGAGMIFVSALSILSILRDYRTGEAIYEAAAQTYLTPMAKTEEPSAEPASAPVRMEVDWAALATVNPDIVGWLHFEDGTLDYPVLYSGDNERYLRRSFTGETVSAGSIFLAAENAPDFSEDCAVLYGHNMKDGSMFGGLRAFRQEAYWEDHGILQLYLPHGQGRRYQVFACIEVAAEDDLYRSGSAAREDLRSLAREALYPDGGEGVRTILLLSTCTAGQQRLVVCAAERERWNEATALGAAESEDTP